MLGYMRPAGLSEAGKRMEAVGRAYEARHPQPRPEPRRAAPPAGVPLVRLNYRKPEPPPPAKPERDWLIVEPGPLTGIPAVEAIFDSAERLFKVTRTLIESEARTRQVTLARHYVTQRLYDELGWTLPKIARATSRDHSSAKRANSSRARERVRDWLGAPR